MKYYDNILGVIGNTPTIKLNKYTKKYKLKVEIYAKLESLNPLGSIKDRVALSMIEEAEEKNLLSEDTHIIEATSGNLGISLASICAIKGYRLTLVMPEITSIERRKIMTSLGASIVLTDSTLGLDGATEKANAIAESTPNSFSLNQFTNPANIAIHKNTTAKELYESLEDVDIIVVGTGSGGTIMGMSEFFKEKNPNVEIYAVEPANSSVLLGKEPGSHPIVGIGPGFVPDILDEKVLTNIIPVSNIDAFTAVKDIAREEGILVGISSGAVLHGAKEISTLSTNHGKKIAVIFPDDGERYINTGVFE